MRNFKLLTYENGLLFILSFAFGIAFFDRNAASILVPFIERDLRLSNTEVGLIGSGLSITWAIGAYVIGRWSDATGVRKPFLLSFLIIFSLCSFLSGLVQTFPMLLLARLVMGAVEGPFLPICLAIMLVESSETRRGVNAGIMQNFFASVLGQSLAPLLLVPLAASLGWRSAFYISGLPGLLCAVAVFLWVREPPKVSSPVVTVSPSAAQAPDMGLFAMLRVRNIVVCCAIAVLMVAWFVIGWTYLPKFLTDYRHFSPHTMSYLMTVLGVASALAAVIVPAISDRIGRKPTMIGCGLVGMATPLAALYVAAPGLLMAALMFVGWMGCGSFPLFMGVVPGESIARRYAATAMGLIVCAGEIVGGTAINSLAGVVADHSSLATTVLIEAACALAGGLLCLLLIETAPVKRRAVIGAASLQGVA
jgi:MFS family permease